MARCESCGALVVAGCACAVADTDCIEATGSGNAGNPVVLAPRISANVDNIISCTDDGLLGLIPPNILNPPGCKARRDATQSVPNNSTALVVFDVEEWDTDGYISVPSEKMFITVPGLYVILGQVRLASAAASGFFGVTVFVDDEGQAADVIDATPSANNTVSQAFCVAMLEEGAEVSLGATNRTGASRNIEGTGRGTTLAIHRIGDLS